MVSAEPILYMRRLWYYVAVGVTPPTQSWRAQYDAASEMPIFLATPRDIIAQLPDLDALYVYDKEG